MPEPQDLIPISSLFFDGPGPHVVRAGFPSAKPPRSPSFTPARGQELRALLDTSITQLGAVSGAAVRRKTPTLPLPVAIETLLYRGDAALRKALELREEIVATKGEVPRAKLDELLDLVALAATE
jgi:hypothetical protein